MAPLKLPAFRIEENSANADIEKLTEKVMPEWPQDSKQIKKMSGGFSCSTYHCYLADKPQEGVTIRVRKMSQVTKLPLLDEEFEHKTVELISELGIFPKLIAIFQNGYCYEFISGEVLINISETKDHQNLLLYEDLTLQRIANKLVSIHSVTMEGEDYSQTKFLNRLSETLNDCYAELPDIPNKNCLQLELQEIIKYADQLKLKIVLCHGDSHPGNMIWNKDKKQVTFIDWEIAHIGYQAYDVAYFLNSISFMDLVFGPEKCLPKESSERLQTQFLGLYFNEWNQKDNSIDYTTFCNHVKFGNLLFFLVMPILFGAIIIGIDDFPLDIKQMMNFYFDKYVEEKNKVIHQLGLSTT